MIKLSGATTGEMSSFCTLKDLAMIKRIGLDNVFFPCFCTLKDLAMIKQKNFGIRGV